MISLDIAMKGILTIMLWGVVELNVWHYRTRKRMTPEDRAREDGDREF